MPGSAQIGNLAVNLTLETAAFSAGASKAQASMRGLTAEAQNMGRGLRSAGNTGKLTSFHMQNLGFQLNDVFVSLASGQNPMRVFVQQGSQIAQISAQAGVGLGGMAKAVLGIIAPFAGVAAGAVLLATAFLGVKQATDGTDLKSYIDSLGLTKKEIDRLKDTTVTWGDVTKATFQVLAEKAGTSSSAITGAFSSAFKSIGEFGKFAASILLASFGAAVKGLADIVTNLPSIVSGAVAAAANLGIAALEKMVNLGIAGLNKLGSTINGVLGTSFAQVADVSLGRVQGSFSGTMKAIGADVSGTFHRIFNQTEATFDQISARAVKVAKGRILDQANDIIGDRADKAGKKAKKAKEEVDHLAEAMKHLQGLLNDFDNAKLDSDITDVKPLSNIDFSDIKLAFKEEVQTPWQQWAASVPQTAAETSAAFQSIAFRGVDSISMAISDVISGARSLKDAFGDVARSIISNLVEMAAKMLIFRALSGILGGGASFDSAGFSNIVGSNSAALGVRMPGMASGGSGVFGGFGGVDRNVLSLNGSPIARVSRGEQFSVSPANNNSRVIIELNDGMLDARIADGSQVQIVRAYPGISAGIRQSIGEKGRRSA